MITPNFNLLMWILFIIVSFQAISRIILGIAGSEKQNRYDGGDVIVGIIYLALMAWVAFS